MIAHRGAGTIKNKKNINRSMKLQITWSTTPANGVDVTSSPPAATSFSTTFKAWSSGGHSDFWHSCKMRWAPSLMDEPGLGNVVGAAPSTKAFFNLKKQRNYF